MEKRKVVVNKRYNTDGTVRISTVVEIKTFAGWLTVKGSSATVLILAADAQDYLESLK